ncbi:MAG: LPXTG cell wall anchor domain-containing protein [Erysipelotrichaceae bacterium]
MNKFIKLKKMLSSLVVLALAIGLVSVNVKAASIKVFYDGKAVQEGTTTIGEGSMKLDKASNTLTLDNVNRKSIAKNTLHIDGNTNDVFTIKLIGNNTINKNGEEAILSDTSLNIEGPGNLTIHHDGSGSTESPDTINLITVLGNLNIANTNLNLKGEPKGSVNMGIGCNNLMIEKSTLNIESVSHGIMSLDYTNIKESTINFKNVNIGLNTIGTSDMDKTVLLKTNINVIETKNMETLLETGDLIIDQCNINNGDTLNQVGISSNGNVDIKNNSVIKLNTSEHSIKMLDNFNISDSYVNLSADKFMAILTGNSMNIMNSEVIAKTVNGNHAIWAQLEQDTTLNRNKLIVLDKNLEEINNYKVDTSGYVNPLAPVSTYFSVFTTDGLPLKPDYSNAAKDIHISVKKADYTAVDAAINAVPSNLSIYTAASVKTLNTTLNAVVRDLKITQQATVDQYAKDINKAIADLVLILVEEPTISEGNNQTINEGSDAVFKSNADLKDFIKVTIDGKDVDKTNYEVKSGSTIVTLKKSYLDTLSEGTHNLGIVSKNGTATASFTIKKNSKPISTPDTGINNGFSLFVGLLLISGMGIMVIKRKEMK